MKNNYFREKIYYDYVNKLPKAVTIFIKLSIKDFVLILFMKMILPKLLKFSSYDKILLASISKFNNFIAG